MRGHTYKRCPCGTTRDAQGRRVACPKKHGSWYYVHEAPPDAQGRRRQVARGGFPTERAARAALNEALADVGRGSYVPATRQTVGEFLDHWLAGKGRLRPSTRRSYDEHVKLYLRPGLGHIRITELRDVDVERLYAAMGEIGRDDSGRQPSPLVRRLLEARSGGVANRPLSAARVRRVHATLLSALNSAVKRKHVAYNPALHVELPAGRRPRAVVWTQDRVAAWKRDGYRPPVAVWTPEQAGAFLDAAAAERLYPLFHVIAYRGLRRGEAVGLRWQDVDLTGRALHIAQQIVQLGWATEIGEPKTDSGVRTVSLDAATVEVLEAWRRNQDGERAGWGAGWHDTGLVFTREDGTQLHPDLATDAFQRICRRAGLPPIRLHDLRHTAASLALQAGVPMKVVSEQLGHSSLAITADTYTSVLPAVAHAAAEAVAGIVPRAPHADVAAAALAVRYQLNPKEPKLITKTEPSGVKPQVNQGGPRGARTHNPRIKSPLLCQLS